MVSMARAVNRPGLGCGLWWRWRGYNTSTELSEVFVPRAWAHLGLLPTPKVPGEPWEGSAWDQSLEGRKEDSVVLSWGPSHQSSVELSGMPFLLLTPALFSWFACASFVCPR